MLARFQGRDIPDVGEGALFLETVAWRADVMGFLELGWAAGTVVAHVARGTGRAWSVVVFGTLGAGTAGLTVGAWAWGKAAAGDAAGASAHAVDTGGWTHGEVAVVCSWRRSSAPVGVVGARALCVYLWVDVESL